MKLLKLTLSKKPFEVMLTGEKDKEYRRPSRWIKSRLFDAEFNKKEYTHILFKNGYSPESPYFIYEYKGFTFAESYERLSFSNGLEVDVMSNDIIINLGLVVETGYIN